MRNFLFKFQRFMYGRYGSDRFNIFLLLLGLFISVLGNILHLYFFIYITYVLYIFAIFRMLSKNYDARRKELYTYYKVISPVQKLFSNISKWIKFRKRVFNDRKVYRYFKCPNCKQQLRAPVGRGKIQVSCQKCHKEFIKKV